MQRSPLVSLSRKVSNLGYDVSLLLLPKDLKLTVINCLRLCLKGPLFTTLELC